VLAIRSGKERIGKKNLTNLRKDPTQRAQINPHARASPQPFSSARTMLKGFDAIPFSKQTGQHETDGKEEPQSIT